MKQLTPEEEFEAARNLEPDDCNIAAVGGARRVSWYGTRRCSSCGRHGGDHEADCLRREQRASDNGSPVSVQSAPPAQTVKRALEIAAHSPCRSKHGVVLFDPQGAFSGAGHNGPPNGTCPGRLICAGACSQFSVHAAQRTAQHDRQRARRAGDDPAPQGEAVSFQLHLAVGL